MKHRLPDNIFFWKWLLDNGYSCRNEVMKSKLAVSIVCCLKHTKYFSADRMFMKNSQCLQLVPLKLRREFSKPDYWENMGKNTIFHWGKEQFPMLELYWNDKIPVFHNIGKTGHNFP